MKIKLFIVFGWVALLLSACHGVSESERMEEALAQGEVLYGEGDNDSLVFVPGLEQAALYFAERKQWSKAAHAALYNGRAQNAANNKTAAMQSFKAAEQYGRQAGDTLTVAWARYETGRLLFKEGRVEESLAVFGEAESTFGKSLEGCSLSANMRACCYLARQQYDSVAACLERSMAYAEQAGSDLAKRKTLNNYSVLYYMQGDYETSKNYLRRIMTETLRPDLALLYLNIGDVYFGSGVMDSAARYYRLLEELLPLAEVKDETKVSAYRAFSRFAERQGDPSKALRYERLRSDMSRKIMEQRESESVYRVQRRYDFEALRNEAEIRDARRQRDIALLCIALMLAIFTVLIVIHKLRQKSLQNEMIQKELEVLKQASVDASVLDEELSWHLRLLSKIKQTKEKTELSASVKQGNMESFILGKKTLFEASVGVLEQAYPDLYRLICLRYPNLSETETKVCLFSCFYLSNNDIANLLGISIHTVNKCRSNIYNKLELNSSNFKGLIKMVITSSEQQ